MKHGINKHQDLMLAVAACTFRHQPFTMADLQDAICQEAKIPADSPLRQSSTLWARMAEKDRGLEAQGYIERIGRGQFKVVPSDWLVVDMDVPTTLDVSALLARLARRKHHGGPRGASTRKDKKMLIFLSDDQGGDCHICGLFLPEAFHCCFDHRHAYHDNPDLHNAWWNLRAAHYGCNVFKGKRSLEDTWADIADGKGPKHFDLAKARAAEARAAKAKPRFGPDR